MRYFILKQDRNLEKAIILKGFNNSKRVMLFKEDEDKYKDSANVYIESNTNSVYPDFIQAPVLLISDRLYEIFKWYENTIIYKIAVLTNLEKCTQNVYRLAITDIIDVLSEKSTYLKNGWIDKIVLDSKKTSKYNIFQVKAGVDYFFIVSLDVVESILKRGFIGIEYEEVEVE